MGIRLYFTYERKYLGVQKGVVSIDVDDQYDREEINRRLQAEDFSSFLPREDAQETKEWDFSYKGTEK